MSKELEKQEASKEVVEQITSTEARDIVMENLEVDCEPDFIFRKIARTIEKSRVDDKKEKKAAGDELIEIFKKFLLPTALETHYSVAETVEPRYRPIVIEIARRIEKEYDCQTTSGKILAEAIAGAYGRIIQFSAKFSASSSLEYISNEKIAYYTMFSKEVDKAHRQLLVAITTLKQLKNPTIELNVRAKTAFVAQNQQINASNHSIAQDENINPK